MKLCSRIALYVLALAVLAMHLPRFYDRLVFKRIEKTHMFYSPVSRRFIYTESAAAFDSEAAAKAEDHHSDILYKDQDGVYYDRLEFERLLPFIYYRNMEVRGHMPLEIDGVVYDKETVRDERQVMEFSPRNFDGRRPPEDVWPLFEADPGQAALVFPDDRCRSANDALEFVNADYNRVDEDLTHLFTSALKDAGFSFPVRHAGGKFTILKRFDDGVFLVDATGKLFHLIRLHGKPQIRQVPLPDGLVPRFVQVSENNRYHALILDMEGHVHLLERGGYRLRSLNIEGYDADRMDFKIIFNPIYRTVVYSDETIVRAVAMDVNFQPVAGYEHLMARGVRTWKHVLRDLIFPFEITLDSPESEMVKIKIRPGAYAFTFSSLFWLLPAVLYARFRRLRGSAFVSLGALAALAGIYGLIAACFIEER